MTNYIESKNARERDESDTRNTLARRLPPRTLHFREREGRRRACYEGQEIGRNGSGAIFF